MSDSFGGLQDEEHLMCDFESELARLKKKSQSLEIFRFSRHSLGKSSVAGAAA